MKSDPILTADQYDQHCLTSPLATQQLEDLVVRRAEEKVEAGVVMEVEVVMVGADGGGETGGEWLKWVTGSGDEGGDGGDGEGEGRVDQMEMWRQ